MTETASPTPQELVQRLLDLLDVKDHGGDRFEGRRKIGGIGRVFGGQVIGQALASAERTVPDDRPVHSLHAYFLRGGDEDHEIDFRVERDFDGRSFSNRRVVASQLGKPILNLVASFQKVEEGVHHQDEMPDVAPPEDLQTTRELQAQFIHRVAEQFRPQMVRPNPIELRPVEPAVMTSSDPMPASANTWFRCIAPLPDDPKVHRAILADASDLTLLGTSGQPHGLSWTMGNASGASLDHAMWFHDDFRADDWLLYSKQSPWAGRGRGFNLGQIFTREGRLVASVAQEGVLRRSVKSA